MGKAISVKNLDKSFKNPTLNDEKINHVLKDISIDIDEGEFIVMVGPSGCGKTTFLNCLIGLEPIDSGSIKIKGTDITKLNDDQKADVRSDEFSVIYQLPYWVKSLSVSENVALPILIKGGELSDALELARKSLTEVGLAKRFDYHPAELSGGEQTRVSIARALVSGRHIILADEPTGDVDTKTGQKIMKLLRELNKEKNLTIIMITHNLDYLQFASRKIVMEDGRIIGDSEISESELAQKLEEKIELLKKEQKGSLDED